ncbi:MAG: hypothetical protein KGJ34_00205 [Patescibacteria group bacterium]|nr:hypothetical protein [Patescibacteria group bacterium]
MTEVLPKNHFSDHEFRTKLYQQTLRPKGKHLMRIFDRMEVLEQQLLLATHPATTLLKWDSDMSAYVKCWCEFLLGTWD